MENKEKMKCKYQDMIHKFEILYYEDKYFVTKESNDARFNYYHRLLTDYFEYLMAKQGYDLGKAIYGKQLFFTNDYFTLSDDARLLRAIEMENNGKLPDDIQVIINEIILEIM